jgi:hypothetical protein
MKVAAATKKSARPPASPANAANVPAGHEVVGETLTKLQTAQAAIPYPVEFIAA